MSYTLLISEHRTTGELVGQRKSTETLSEALAVAAAWHGALDETTHRTDAMFIDQPDPGRSPTQTRIYRDGSYR